MRVSVVLLRRRGMRLRMGELAPPLIGDLRISDAGATSYKRPGLHAQLWEPAFSAINRPLGLPLSMLTKNSPEGRNRGERSEIVKYLRLKSWPSGVRGACWLAKLDAIFPGFKTAPEQYPFQTNQAGLKAAG